MPHYLEIVALHCPQGRGEGQVDQNENNELRYQRHHVGIGGGQQEVCDEEGGQRSEQDSGVRLVVEPGLHVAVGQEGPYRPGGEEGEEEGVDEAVDPEVEGQRKERRGDGRLLLREGSEEREDAHQDHHQGKTFEMGLGVQLARECWPDSRSQHTADAERRHQVGLGGPQGIGQEV